MSQRNALRNPRRTGATAAALMMGLALVGGMSVVSASMTKSFDHQIDKTLGADFVVQNGNFAAVPAGGHGQGARHRGRRARRHGSGSPRSPYGCRTASAIETTAAAYDPRLDDVAHITYAQGDTAAALGDGRHRHGRRSFAKDHDVQVGSTSPGRVPGRAHRPS